MADTTLAESLLHALADHGAKEIFGIPGDFALPFFRVIEQSGILPLHTLSHEPAVGFAADAAARLHGTLGVAAVTYGAGALNMVNPVAAAYAEKSPLVVVSGAPGLNERGAGLLLHHQAKTLESQLEVYREITCDRAVLDDPARAPADIARVLGRCLAESRPVYFELPRDLVSEPCAAVVRTDPSPPDADALATCADEILAALREASSPVLVAGVEIRRFGLDAKVAVLAARTRRAHGADAAPARARRGRCAHRARRYRRGGERADRSFQPESAFNDLDDWRFAALADALGGRGRRVTTRAELKVALDAAWAERGRFQLVEIVLERGVLSDSLRRFADGIKRLH